MRRKRGKGLVNEGKGKRKLKYLEYGLGCSIRVKSVWFNHFNFQTLITELNWTEKLKKKYFNNQNWIALAKNRIKLV